MALQLRPSRLSSRLASLVAWSMFGVTIVAITAAVLIGQNTALTGWIVFGLAAFGYSAVGAFVVGRDPGNALAWMFCLCPLAIGCAGFGQQYVEQGGGDWPARTLVGWLSDLGWIVGVGPPIAFFGLLIPDGRLPSRRWRPAAWLSGITLAAVMVGQSFGEARVTGDIANPVVIPYVSSLQTVAGLLALPVMAIGVAATVSRYRRGGVVERQQLKWIIAALLATFAIGIMNSHLPEPVYFASWALLPIAFCVAILRYRLYEIDVIIRKTLVYAMLVAVLATVYLGGVSALGWALRDLAGGSSAVAVTLSTLAVALAFQPLRRRLQRAVDHRFYRSRYDAARTLDAFTRRMRDQVDLETVRSEVLGVVQGALQPGYVSLWLRDPAHSARSSAASRATSRSPR